jgi:hypothetical protein
MPDLSPEEHCEDRTQYEAGAAKVIVHSEFIPDTFFFPFPLPNPEIADFSQGVWPG